MIKRAAVLAVAAILLSVSTPASAAPKSQKKKVKESPEASPSKAVELARPARSPDNVVPAGDNGAKMAADADPPHPVAPGPSAQPKAQDIPEESATAVLGNDAEYNRRLLARAIRMGLLKKGAAPAALTPEILNRMIDAHVLKDAIRHGLLPANGTPAQVTPEIRAVMKKGGYFVHYYPDGSVNSNYGIR